MNLLWLVIYPYEMPGEFSYIFDSVREKSMSFGGPKNPPWVPGLQKFKFPCTVLYFTMALKVLDMAIVLTGLN